ncbi:MAG: hypothetical protein ACPG8W_15355 [Candidatus Promineifilaceae bacterium]
MTQKIARRADHIRFYETAETFGSLAASSLVNRGRSQMTGLENIANSSLKVTDVFNYIKTRTARSKSGREWQDADLGKKLLAFLQNEGLGHLRDDHLKPIVKNMQVRENSAEYQQIYLHLVRAFIHQLVAQYEWAKYEQANKLGGR